MVPMLLAALGFEYGSIVFSKQVLGSEFVLLWLSQFFPCPGFECGPRWVSEAIGFNFGLIQNSKPLDFVLGLLQFDVPVSSSQREGSMCCFEVVAECPRCSKVAVTSINAMKRQSFEKIAKFKPKTGPFVHQGRSQRSRRNQTMK